MHAARRSAGLRRSAACGPQAPVDTHACAPAAHCCRSRTSNGCATTDEPQQARCSEASPGRRSRSSSTACSRLQLAWDQVGSAARRAEHAEPCRSGSAAALHRELQTQERGDCATERPARQASCAACPNWLSSASLWQLSLQGCSCLRLPACVLPKCLCGCAGLWLPYRHS